MRLSFIDETAVKQLKIWLNFFVQVSSKCRKTGIEKKFVAEGSMGRKTQKGFANIFIVKSSSIMHLAMVPRFIWREDVFHHLLKSFKIADLLYAHYLLFYSLWWERIFCCSANSIIFSYTQPCMTDSQDEYILEVERFEKGVGVRQLMCWKQQKP